MDVGELVEAGAEEQPQHAVAQQRLALRVGEVGQVLGDDQQRAREVPGAARPFVEPRAGGRGQQRLPGLVDRDERAARPRPRRLAGMGEVVRAAALDVAVDEVDERQHHRPGERVGQPGEVEEQQRRAGRIVVVGSASQADGPSSM